MSTVEVFSPAKINLFLAVTGRRPDGYHDLVSVAAPLEWGDRLLCALREGEADGCTLACDDPAVPLDESNLILKAAARFRAASGWRRNVAFTLAKRIPIGAGLGGGSSNAAAALKALNRLAGGPLDPAALARAAAEVGSDCALFLAGVPVAMRGRGERVEPLADAAAARLRGRRLLLFKPGFGVSTPWAYGRLAASGAYLPAAEAEARLAAWAAGAAPAEELLYNNMEPPVFAKFPALPLLLERLQADFGLAGRMSGSGSCCFALLPGAGPAPSAVAAAIRESWGASAFLVETRLA
ncbi:MAG TPA: 4-(cytidine 5'-diphospho)-2-C-methyl-D-erythritol kinase [Opitutaceae bacterium]|nr:4-(cytidine 5'-diphospho)-2-C-methyl-D-erythritol kinase [Opitutaceae bacterium]